MHLDILRYSSSSSPTINQLKKATSLFDDDLDEVENQMKSLGIQAIRDGDPEFPVKCKEMTPQPYILYYQGDISLLQRPILGIVGPRQPSIYAGKILDRLFKTIDRYNLVTVSGLAPGIDQLAHRLSIKKGIPTIAVLGGGLGEYLQKSDRHLIASIVENGGLVISEFRLFQTPENYTFPQRNRIIAGLSDVLFLPEAGKKSGSLITVDFAHKIGRPIYGTPYDICSIESQGLHQQMELGIVKPVFEFESMFKRHFSSKKTKIIQKQISIDLSSDESLVLQCLQKAKTCSLQYISNFTKCSYISLLGTITLLELKQLIIQISPGIYSIL
ncbi:MAG: DNA-processing protein DprA [Candidatus Absconditabacteria bacterium]